MTSEPPVIDSLDDLAALVDGRTDLFVRWSGGPDADEGTTSRDSLTGVELPGLCASPLAVEPWWGERSLRTWVARRIYDYCHLRHDRPAGTRPWVLSGREVGRGPDNEPVVDDWEAVAWLTDDVVREADEEIESEPGGWGPLDRTSNA